ncbi:restriction endonuclease subunit S [Rhodococcoides fascians]|uniref:restriction endonuclease subunit S n=1 Tax=Rhodococcoides fascians TaxID=1828 RepID=UPI0024B8AE4D|nr:restriction endonuclease subunit S [Rhodococcus fascians]MDJ0412086.1 restriction endonuclease subunit S [Rhodococcus fascians]
MANSSPWLGELPAHWKTVRTKSLLVERVEKGHQEEPLLAATQSHGVIRKSEYGIRTVTATKDLHLLKLVEVGDFVISLRSFQGGIERCYHRGIISPAYTVLTARSTKDRDYLTYLFKSKPFISSLTLSVTGIREGQNIDYSTLAVDLLPVPPAEEQVSIVKYLTHANARIDKAIAAKQRLIALLQERKREVVNRLVTEGLDPDVAFVDSGVPWIGLVPEHWGLVPARHIFRPVSRTVTDSALPQLSLTRSAGLVPSGTEGSGTTAAESAGNLQQCARGDFVLNKYRAHMGLFRWCRAPGIVTRNYTVLQPKSQVHHDYFESLFLDPVFAEGLRINARGVGDGMSPLYTSTLMSMKMPLPPLEEQRAIMGLINADTSRFSQQIAVTSREIRLLGEFRTRLVADVVTGQVDVRAIGSTLSEAPISFDNLVSAIDDELQEALSETEE